METKYISHPSDWYRVSIHQRNNFGGMTLIAKYGSLFDLLRKYRPHQEWNEVAFSQRNKKSAKRWLWLCVQRIFQAHEVLEEYSQPYCTIN